METLDEAIITISASSGAAVLVGVTLQTQISACTTALLAYVLLQVLIYRCALLLAAETTNSISTSARGASAILIVLICVAGAAGVPATLYVMVKMEVLILVQHVQQQYT